MLDHFIAETSQGTLTALITQPKGMVGSILHFCYHFYQCVVPKVGESPWKRYYAGSSPVIRTIYACVAQLDRATDYESVG